MRFSQICGCDFDIENHPQSWNVLICWGIQKSCIVGLQLSLSPFLSSPVTKNQQFLVSIRDLICIEPDIELGVDVFLSFIANYYLRPFEISTLFFLIAIFFVIHTVLLILLQLRNVSITFISSRRHIFSTLIQSTHFKIFVSLVSIWHLFDVV